MGKAQTRLQHWCARRKLRRMASLKKKFDIPDNLKWHIGCVRRVAFSVAAALAEKGARVNPAKISYAAWLHDVARNSKLGKKGFGWHERIGAAAAFAFGFFPESQIILRHGLIPSRRKWNKYSLAQRILVYSDARVSGNTIVPLEQRAGEVIRRYKPGEKLYDLHVQHYALLAEFEKEMFEKYGIDLAKLPSPKPEKEQLV